MNRITSHTWRIPLINIYIFICLYYKMDAARPRVCQNIKIVTTRKSNKNKNLFYTWNATFVDHDIWNFYRLNYKGSTYSLCHVSARHLLYMDLYGTTPARTVHTYTRTFNYYTEPPVTTMLTPRQPKLLNTFNKCFLPVIRIIYAHYVT